MLASASVCITLLFFLSATRSSHTHPLLPLLYKARKMCFKDCIFHGDHLLERKRTYIKALSAKKTKITKVSGTHCLKKGRNNIFKTVNKLRHFKKLTDRANFLCSIKN